MKYNTKLIDDVRDAETPKDLCNALHAIASAIGTGKQHYYSIDAGVKRSADEMPIATLSLELVLMPEPKDE